MIRRICDDLDFEIFFPRRSLELTRIETKEEFLKSEKEKKEEKWLAEQFYDFLRGWDTRDIHPISILLTPYTTGKPYNTDKNKRLDLKRRLEAKKSEIDDFIDGDKEKEKYYSWISTILDPFSNFRRHVQKVLKDYDKNKKTTYITNAFLKGWELIQQFRLIPYDHSSNYTVFCNAEFPGAFIFAIHKYIIEQTKHPMYEWYANSLFNEENIGELQDEFKLYEKYPQRWLMDGKENNGDVTKLKTVDSVRERLGDQVDLYTSDIGIPLDQTNFNQQEELEAVLNLGQVLCGLSTLKKGGYMVCKMFLFFTPFNMSLLSLLNDLFDEFYLSKPVTSRPGNSEIYIVGKGFHGYNECLPAITELRNALEGWNEKSVNVPVAEIREEFYTKLLNSSYQIYERQIRFLEMNIQIAKKCYEENIKPYESSTKEIKEELELRKKMFDEWKWQFNGNFLYRPTRNDL